ncbi:MAG TPA: hypothetical protein VJT73_11090, partial [Polyangiaceae bacterium]|nr:hypothetical protein [Polyangiaceae bacterium]
ESIEVRPVVNRYPLQYWMKLFPAPAAIKGTTLRALAATRLGRLPIAVRAGNLAAVGYKPVGSPAR